MSDFSLKDCESLRTEYVCCISSRTLIERILQNSENKNKLKRCILISIINPDNRYKNVLKDIKTIENFFKNDFENILEIDVYLGNGKFQTKTFYKKHKEDIKELKEYLLRLEKIIKRTNMEDKNTTPIKKELLDLLYDNLTISFWDIEENSKRYKIITNKQARKIAEFIYKYKNKVKNRKLNFVIHCSAGISRSSAVAMAIHCCYDFDGRYEEFVKKLNFCKIFNDTRYFPNYTVFKKISDEYMLLLKELKNDKK